MSLNKWGTGQKNGEEEVNNRRNKRTDRGDTAKNGENKKEQKNKPVRLQFLPLPAVFFWQYAADHFKSIQRMNGDQVKDCQNNIEDNDGLEKSDNQIHQYSNK